MIITLKNAHQRKRDMNQGLFHLIVLKTKFYEKAGYRAYFDRTPKRLQSLFVPITVFHIYNSKNLLGGAGNSYFY